MKLSFKDQVVCVFFFFSSLEVPSWYSKRFGSGVSEFGLWILNLEYFILTQDFSSFKALFTSFDFFPK